MLGEINYVYFEEKSDGSEVSVIFWQRGKTRHHQMKAFFLKMKKSKSVFTKSI